MGPDWLTLSGAFIAGLLGSGHCAAMCGGLAVGFGSAAGVGGGPAMLLPAFQINLGRVLGYTLAGALVAGFAGGLVTAIAMEQVLFAARLAVGGVLILIGLRLLDRSGRLAPRASPGGWLWVRLRPLTRRLLPATTVPRRLALGALWGWLPCGLSWTVLFAAAFSINALSGAATMFAFGLGTLPAMVPITWGGGRIARRLSSGRTRLALGGLVIVAGVITVAAPWLAAIPFLHEVLGVLGCRTVPVAS